MRGFFVWRQNNVGVWDSAKGVYRKGNGLRGVSDVLGLHIGTGKLIAVEVKAGKDALSDFQRAFLKQVQDAGGVAIVARDFEGFRIDLDALVNTWRCIMGNTAEHSNKSLKMQNTETEILGNYLHGRSAFTIIRLPDCLHWCKDTQAFGALENATLFCGYEAMALELEKVRNTTKNKNN